MTYDNDAMIYFVLVNGLCLKRLDLLDDYDQAWAP